MTFAASLKSIRLVHRYIGLFFAPTVLFFAITGGLQMFGLHETSRGSSYVPPPLLAHLSQLHKKGTLYFPARRPAPPSSARPDSPRTDAPRPDAPKPDTPKTDAPRADAPKSSPAPNPLPIKIFFAATALALVISTCTGIFMAWKFERRKAVVVGVLLAGICCPLLLLLL